MKHAGEVEIPVFNIFTDFFIHHGWGTKQIDGHFVSTPNMKSFLLKRGIDGAQIYLTGIPIHPMLNRKPIIPEPPRYKINVLISGGSMGSGQITQLINNLSYHKLFHYYILCGKNERLYRYVRKMNRTYVTPIPFIQSRKMMDFIYNTADLIVTKPGGVTVTECIKSGFPFLFIINCRARKNKFP